MSKKIDTAARDEAIRNLKHAYGIKPKSEIYTLCEHVSRSGMSRSVRLFIVHGKDLLHISWTVAQALGEKLNKHGGITVGGCGFDAGYELVYNLGKALWPKGTSKPHGTRNGEPDSDGGYALKQRSI